MIDRLAEIKAKRSFADPLHNDVDWLIAEVEDQQKAHDELAALYNEAVTEVERLEAERAEVEDFVSAIAGESPYQPMKFYIKRASKLLAALRSTGDSDE